MLNASFFLYFLILYFILVIEFSVFGLVYSGDICGCGFLLQLGPVYLFTVNMNIEKHEKNYIRYHSAYFKLKFNIFVLFECNMPSGLLESII